MPSRNGNLVVFCRLWKLIYGCNVRGGFMGGKQIGGENISNDGLGCIGLVGVGRGTDGGRGHTDS